jgi:uncharacterized protein
LSADPWVVPVTSLRRANGVRREEIRRGRIGELRVADSVVPSDAEASAVATLDSVDGGIEVTALVSAPWRAECRRCLKPVGGELNCDVREVFRPRQPGERASDDEETYPLTGDQLDLRPLVRDALLLGLPIAPLCREDCAGLCPTCGSDLNEGPCSCAAPDPDPRWGALEALRDPPADAGGATTA